MIVEDCKEIAEVILAKYRGTIEDSELKVSRKTEYMWVGGEDKDRKIMMDNILKRKLNCVVCGPTSLKKKILNNSRECCLTKIYRKKRG